MDGQIAQVGVCTDDINAMRPPLSPLAPAAPSGGPGRAPSARQPPDRSAVATAPASGWRGRMPLGRRVGLMVVLALVIALAGGAAVSIWAVRGALQTGMQQRNVERAAALAVALSRQQGDRTLIERVLAAEFASGAYERIRFDASDGAAPFVRQREASLGVAPDWLMDRTALAPDRAMAQVSDRGRTVGTVEVAVSPGSANELLLRTSLDAALAMTGIGLVAGLLAAGALWTVRRMLATVVRQARVLVGGKFVTLPEPPSPELQMMTRAMNSMVERLKAAVDVQVAQVEQLRKQAHVDTLTGLSNRRHFLAQLEAALRREDGTARCGLVLMRLRDLAGVNLSLGHTATDRMLGAIAQTLRTYGERVPGCFLGRLNGADFALCLPVGGLTLETAQALAATMHAVLPSIGPGVAVALGGVELRHGTPLAHALSDADEALARAEARGAFGVEVLDQGHVERSGIGEAAWRQGLDCALSNGRAMLAGYAVVDSSAALVHLESPLRLQLQAGGAFEAAAHWLPLAVRTRMTGEIDACAVALAIQAIARDGKPRSVNLAPASLAEGDFAARLRALLFASPRAARKLSLEMAEAAAVERFGLLKELARHVRPCGVRFGLEHAGAHLGRIDHLFEDWLDFVKLDASVTRGVGGDAQRAGFVRASVELLHGIAIDVYAEGVCDDGDAQALWRCGVDGITGPWASARSSAGDA